MLRLLIVAAICFGSVLFAFRCSARDLELVESAAAAKVTLPIKNNSATLLQAGSLEAGNAGVLAATLVYRNSLGQGTEGGQGFEQFKVVSVVDSSNLIVTYDKTSWNPMTGHTTHHPIRLWLKGFSTTGIVDDDQVTIPWTIKVTGTKAYTTALGAKSTVILIEPYKETDEERRAREEAIRKLQQANEEAAQKQRQAKEEAAEKERRAIEEAAQKQRKAKEEAAEKQRKETQAEQDRKAAAENARYRVWSDSSRTHTVEARFKYVVGNQVKLAKRDGTEISILLEKLSEDDQAWIRDRSKKKL